MSAQQGMSLSGYGENVAAPSRPTTLKMAVWGGLLTGVLSLAGAVIMIAQGKESIRAYLREESGVDVGDLVETALAAELDEAYSTLVLKAGIGIGFALVVLLLAVLARGGATAARVGLAVALVLNMCAGSGLQMGESDVLPSLTVVIAAVTPLLALVTIVLVFLPATNRYAAARKRTRA